MRSTLAFFTFSLLLSACTGVRPSDDSAAAPTAVATEAKPSPRGAVLRWHRRTDADGKIPEGALYREAVAHRARLATTPALSGGPTNWELLGPGNIGGRIRSILIHPSNPQVMYVGSVAGGAWKSTNGGGSWTMLPDLPVVLAITTMVMHPNDPDTIYAGHR